MICFSHSYTSEHRSHGRRSRTQQRHGFGRAGERYRLFRKLDLCSRWSYRTQSRQIRRLQSKQNIFIVSPAPCAATTRRPSCSPAITTTVGRVSRHCPSPARNVDSSLWRRRAAAAHLPLKETPPPMCPEHDKTMKIFCFDCNRVIFRNCLLYDHREHKSNFLNMCATEARKTLHDTLLRRVQANITGARKNLAGTESQVGSEDEDICQTVKRSFRQFRAVLEQRETELLKNCADSGPREERCSDSSEEGASNGPDRNPEPCRVCGAERRGHQRPRSDGHLHTTAVQGGGGRETSSAAVLRSSHHSRPGLYHSPSLKAIPRDLGEVFQQSPSNPRIF